MAKQEAVAAMVAAVQAAQLQALTDAGNTLYDQAAADQKASDGSFTQADINAAVSAAQGVDAKALADSQAQAAAALAAVQQQLVAMTAKEQAEENVVIGLQSSVSQVQAALDAIKALIFPAPVPAPVSAPAPVSGT